MNVTRCTIEYRKMNGVNPGGWGPDKTHPFPFRYRPKQRVRLRVMPAAYSVTTGWVWVGVKAVAGRPGRVRDRWGVRGRSDRLQSRPLGSARP
jgi:hypothetical protein